jgi:hypothetical protein
VMPCGLVDIYKRFRGPCCLHLPPRWWRQHGPPKYCNSTSLHVMSQKMIIFTLPSNWHVAGSYI